MARADRRGNRGQALTEFALILPVLAVLLLAIVQFGVIFGAQVGLTNAVREAARYASTSPLSSESQVPALSADTICYLTGTGPSCAQPGILNQYVLLYQASHLTSRSVTYCSYHDPSQTTYSIRIVVSATYDHPIFIPLISAILGSIPGSASEQFRVENQPLQSTDIPTCT